MIDASFHYPTDETLEIIEKWSVKSFDSCAALLKFVETKWEYPDHFRVSYAKNAAVGTRLYELSTGGWSGNESLIGAMEANVMFMTLCWEMRRRGGHYEFILPPEPSDE